MTPMTKRERVLRTIRFEETDRVPIYDLLQNDPIIEHYTGLKATPENGEWVVGVAAGRVFDMTRGVGAPGTPNTVRRDDGFLVRTERWTGWIVERPFRDVEMLVPWVKEDIRKISASSFGAEQVEKTRAYVRKRLDAMAAGDPTGRNDPAVYVVESGVGLTEMYHTAGMQLFAELAFEYPDLIEEWIEARNQAELRRVAAIADPELIPVVLPYDDIAFKNNLLFSPDWLRQYWTPRLKRLVDAWHARDTYCLFHSDGNLWPILDDLVAAGIDGLNPLEVLAGMTVGAVRQQYPKLFLTGGIDVSQLLSNGTPEEVRAACQQAIADSGGRGYFLGSTTELHWEVRLENAIAMFETAWGTVRATDKSA